MAADKTIGVKIRYDNPPENFAKGMESALQRAAKEGRKITDTVTGWKKELGYASFVLDEHKRKYEGLHKQIERIEKSYERTHDEKKLEHVEKLSRQLERVTKEYEKQARIVSAIKGHIAQMSGNGSALLSNLLSGFARGGLPGAASALLSSGLGRLGAVGALAYGASKTYDWVQEKSQLAREYYGAGNQLSRRAGVGYDIANAIRAGNIGAAYNYSDMQIMELAGAVGERTGSKFLKNTSALNSLAGFSRRQGMTFEETSELLAVGAHAGTIKGSEGVGEYMDTVALSMAKGVEMGFGKSERMQQLIKAVQQTGGETREVTKEGFKNMVTTMHLLESTGVTALKGEGALRVMAGMNSLLTPGENSTPLFATLMASGAIPKSLMSDIQKKAGISDSVWSQMSPQAQMEAIQNTMRNEGMGFDVYNAIKKSPQLQNSPFKIDLLSQIFGIDKTTLAKMESQDVSKEKFQELMKEKDSKKDLASNILGLQSAFSTYIKAQSELNKSTTALEKIIGIEVALRKAELILSGKINGSNLDRLDDATLETMMEQGIPGASEAWKKRLNVSGVNAASDISSEYGAFYQPGSYKDAATSKMTNDRLFNALIMQESGWNQHAVSKTGAVGYGQLTSSGALGDYNQTFGTKYTKKDVLENGDLNLQISKWYYDKLMKMYPDDPELAITAYNAGPGTVNEAVRKGGRQNFRAYLKNAEQRDYYGNVMKRYESGTLAAQRNMLMRKDALDVNVNLNADDTTAQKFAYDKTGIITGVNQVMQNNVKPLPQ